MRKTMAILTMAVALLAQTSVPALAVPQGPFCFSPAPFSDLFVFFFDSNGANQFVGTGRDLATGAGISGTLFLTGNLGVLSFVVPASPDIPGNHTFMGTANIDLGSGAGPGVCETVNSVFGCGTGSSFTMFLVSCPPGSLSSAEKTVSGAGALMGGGSR